MTDVHTAILEAHAWDGRTNDRGIGIIKSCAGWPKGGKALRMSCRVLDDRVWKSKGSERKTGDHD